MRRTNAFFFVFKQRNFPNSKMKGIFLKQKESLVWMEINFLQFQWKMKVNLKILQYHSYLYKTVFIPFFIEIQHALTQFHYQFHTASNTLWTIPNCFDILRKCELYFWCVAFVLLFFLMQYNSAHSIGKWIEKRHASLSERYTQSMVRNWSTKIV